MHQPCKSNTGKSRSYLPLSFAANTALKASNQKKSKIQPRAISTTSVVALRYSFAASAAQLADSTHARKVKSRVQHLIRNRYYDPHTGRFTAEDPMPNTNRYPYVFNNPETMVDPWGLDSQRSGECCDKSCCPSLAARIKRVHEILDTKGHPSGPTSVGGETLCVGVRLPGNQMITQAYVSNYDTNPCTRPCTALHENVHVRQCLSMGFIRFAEINVSSNWTLEYPAYTTELGCLLARYYKCCEPIDPK